MLRKIKSALSWRRRLYDRVNANPDWCVKYLRLAKFLCSRGIKPPLSLSLERQEKRWRNQGHEDSDIQPEIYTVANDSLQKLFADVLPLLNKDSAILEVGCNAGRSLNYLYQKGFRNLTGIEIGPRALELFANTFPETYQNSTIIEGNAADELKKIESQSFDLVFTHSVLIAIGAKHNHVFREMCRICRGYILTLESEGHWRAFPRDFQRMFEKNGFAMIAFRWLVWGEDEKLIFPHPVTNDHILRNNTIRLYAPVEKRRK